MVPDGGVSTASATKTAESTGIFATKLEGVVGTCQNKRMRRFKCVTRVNS